MGHEGVFHVLRLWLARLCSWRESDSHEHTIRQRGRERVHKQQVTRNVHLKSVYKVSYPWTRGKMCVSSPPMSEMHLRQNQIFSIFMLRLSRDYLTSHSSIKMISLLMHVCMGAVCVLWASFHLSTTLNGVPSRTMCNLQRWLSPERMDEFH